MADRIPNSRVSEVFRGLVKYLYDQDSLHSFVVQPDSPVSFIGYDRRITPVDIIFGVQQTGQLARNFVHSAITAESIRERNVAYEIFQDGEHLLFITLLRNDTKLSVVVTARKPIETLLRNFQLTADYFRFDGKAATAGNTVGEVIRAQGLSQLAGKLMNSKGLLVITGPNSYLNNVFGLQMLHLLGSQKDRNRVITTLENPIYADIKPQGYILYRHQFLKDIYSLAELLRNNTILNQTDIFYLNQPGFVYADHETRSLFDGVRNSKLTILIEANKTVEEILAEYQHDDSITIFQLNA